MPRPKSRSELLEQSQVNFAKLLSFIDDLTPVEQRLEFAPDIMNRSIRDVLMHLHHWHLLMLGWYEVGVAGGKPPMPAKGYTWRTVPELNKWILSQYVDVSLEQAIETLKKSFQDVRDLIIKHPEETLFVKKHYRWTGSTSLGAYFVSATSSHYGWALKLIKKNLK